MKVVSQLLVASCALSMLVSANPARRQMESEDGFDMTDGVSASDATETGLLESAEDEIVCLADDTCPAGYSKIPEDTTSSFIPVVEPMGGRPDDGGLPLPADAASDSVPCQQGILLCPDGGSINGLRTCCPAGYTIDSLNMDGPSVFGGRRSISRRNTCECTKESAPGRRALGDPINNSDLDAAGDDLDQEAEALDEQTNNLFDETDDLFDETDDLGAAADNLDSQIDSIRDESDALATQFPIAPENQDQCMCRRNDLEDVTPTEDITDALASGAEDGPMPCQKDDECAGSIAMGGTMVCCPVGFEMMEPTVSDEECMCTPITFGL